VASAHSIVTVKTRTIEFQAAPKNDSDPKRALRKGIHTSLGFWIGSTTRQSKIVFLLGLGVNLKFVPRICLRTPLKQTESCFVRC
jgi:hypothetical protein